MEIGCHAEKEACYQCKKEIQQNTMVAIIRRNKAKSNTFILPNELDISVNNYGEGAEECSIKPPAEGQLWGEAMS